MPWCDDCSKFWNPPEHGPGGECPTCGTVIATPAKGVPWHFKVMLVGLAGYMVYRIYWLAEWLPEARLMALTPEATCPRLRAAY